MNPLAALLGGLVGLAAAKFFNGALSESDEKSTQPIGNPKGKPALAKTMPMPENPPVPVEKGESSVEKSHPSVDSLSDSGDNA